MKCWEPVPGRGDGAPHPQTEMSDAPSFGGYGDGVNRRRRSTCRNPREPPPSSRTGGTMTMCTFNHDGTIHAVAMWYGFLDRASWQPTRRGSPRRR